MQGLASSLPAAIAGLAVLLLAMVVVMVRFSAAAVEPPPPAAEQVIDPPPRARARRLGALYLLVWAGVIALFLHLMRLTGKPWDARNLGLLALVAGSWLGFNLLWIALVRKLVAKAGPPSGPPTAEQLAAEDAEIARREAEEQGGARREDW